MFSKIINKVNYYKKIMNYVFTLVFDDLKKLRAALIFALVRESLALPSQWQMRIKRECVLFILFRSRLPRAVLH